MSNIHFFGGMKKDNCEHKKNGQCNLFRLKNGARRKVPVATPCRIAECETHNHCHLETSDLPCSFCPRWSHTHLAEISVNDCRLVKKP